MTLIACCMRYSSWSTCICTYLVFICFCLVFSANATDCHLLYVKWDVKHYSFVHPLLHLIKPVVGSFRFCLPVTAYCYRILCYLSHVLMLKNHDSNCKLFVMFSAQSGGDGSADEVPCVLRGWEWEGHIPSTSCTGSWGTWWGPSRAPAEIEFDSC